MTLKKKFFLSFIFAVFLFMTPLAVSSSSPGGRMELSSLAFRNQGVIPIDYTAQGDGVSPPLKWGNVPADTLSFALICEDPDAPNGTFDHWLLYNIPPTVHELPVNFTSASLGIPTGLNSVGKKEYYPPNPPSGTHRYIFTLFALDAPLDLPPGVRKADLLSSMQGHVLAQATLMGHYTKRPEF